MTVDRRDPYTAIPQLEKRLNNLEGKKSIDDDVARINKDVKRAKNDINYIQGEVESVREEMPVIAENERKKYITDINDGGVTVHADGGGANYVLIDDDEVSIVKDSKVVAKYSEDVVIGKQDDYHMSVTPTRIEGRDSGGNPRFCLAYVYDVGTGYGLPQDKCASLCGDGNFVIVSPKLPTYSGFHDDDGHDIEAVNDFYYSVMKLGEHTAKISALAPRTNTTTNNVSAYLSLEAVTDGASTAILKASNININGNLKVNDENISLEGHTHTSRESIKSEWFTAESGVTVTNHCTYNPAVKAFMLNLVIVFPSANAGVWQKAGTVASGFRPPYNTALSASHNTASSNTNTHGVLAFVNANGEVYVKRTTTSTASFTTYVAGMYLI